MKTKKLEKLESFKLKNEKLETVSGGFSVPVINFTMTAGGEMCIDSGCLSYSHDVAFPDGSVMHVGGIIDKPC